MKADNSKRNISMLRKLNKAIKSKIEKQEDIPTWFGEREDSLGQTKPKKHFSRANKILEPIREFKDNKLGHRKLYTEESKDKNHSRPKAGSIHRQEVEIKPDFYQTIKDNSIIKQFISIFAQDHVKSEDYLDKLVSSFSSLRNSYSAYDAKKLAVILLDVFATESQITDAQLILLYTKLELLISRAISTFELPLIKLNKSEILSRKHNQELNLENSSQLGTNKLLNDKKLSSNSLVEQALQLKEVRPHVYLQIKYFHPPHLTNFLSVTKKVQTQTSEQDLTLKFTRDLQDIITNSKSPIMADITQSNNFINWLLQISDGCSANINLKTVFEQIITSQTCTLDVRQIIGLFKQFNFSMIDKIDIVDKYLDHYSVAKHDAKSIKKNDFIKLINSIVTDWQYGSNEIKQIYHLMKHFFVNLEDFAFITKNLHFSGYEVFEFLKYHYESKCDFATLERSVPIMCVNNPAIVVVLLKSMRNEYTLKSEQICSLVKNIAQLEKQKLKFNAVQLLRLVKDFNLNQNDQDAIFNLTDKESLADFESLRHVTLDKDDLTLINKIIVFCDVKPRNVAKIAKQILLNCDNRIILFKNYLKAKSETNANMVLIIKDLISGLTNNDAERCQILVALINNFSELFKNNGYSTILDGVEFNGADKIELYLQVVRTLDQQGVADFITITQALVSQEIKSDLQLINFFTYKYFSDDKLVFFINQIRLINTLVNANLLDRQSKLVLEAKYNNLPYASLLILTDKVSDLISQLSNEDITLFTNQELIEFIRKFSEHDQQTIYFVAIGNELLGSIKKMNINKTELQNLLNCQSGEMGNRQVLGEKFILLLSDMLTGAYQGSRYDANYARIGKIFASSSSIMLVIFERLFAYFPKKYQLLPLFASWDGLSNYKLNLADAPDDDNFDDCIYLHEELKDSGCIPHEFHIQFNKLLKYAYDEATNQIMIYEGFLTKFSFANLPNQITYQNNYNESIFLRDRILFSDLEQKLFFLYKPMSSASDMIELKQLNFVPIEFLVIDEEHGCDENPQLFFEKIQALKKVAYFNSVLFWLAITHEISPYHICQITLSDDDVIISLKQHNSLELCQKRLTLQQYTYFQQHHMKDVASALARFKQHYAVEYNASNTFKKCLNLLDKFFDQLGAARDSELGERFNLWWEHNHTRINTTNEVMTLIGIAAILSGNSYFASLENKNAQALITHVTVAIASTARLRKLVENDKDYKLFINKNDFCIDEYGKKILARIE